MIYIFHGDNPVDSRKKLLELITSEKNKGTNIVRLEAKKLTPPILEENLVNHDLFGTSQLTIVEALHSLPRSKKKNQLITTIQKSNSNIVLWEKRSLTKTMLKKFPQAKTSESKLTKALFKWLDSLSSNQKSKKKQLELLHQSIEIDSAGMCLAMLMRQIRLLIQARENHKIKGPPFMISKLKNQARNFSLQQLLNIHNQLLDFDIKQKSSLNLRTIEQNLDQLIINL